MDVVPPAHPTVTSLYLYYEDLRLGAVGDGGGISTHIVLGPVHMSGAARSYEQYKNFRVFMLGFYFYFYFVLFLL